MGYGLHCCGHIEVDGDCDIQADGSIKCDCMCCSCAYENGDNRDVNVRPFRTCPCEYCEEARKVTVVSVSAAEDAVARPPGVTYAVAEDRTFPIDVVSRVSVSSPFPDTRRPYVVVGRDGSVLTWTRERGLIELGRGTTLEATRAIMRLHGVPLPGWELLDEE